MAELAALEMIEGFPDGTFRADEQLTHAQFAAMINQAFNKVKVRSATAFNSFASSTEINRVSPYTRICSSLL
ncbi:hypothetical protein CI592_07210 [Fischerella thermalis CCMEE 5328]|nr:S-layer homology domain-containing protein [Fischerella thermalis]PMB08773.1 hypothetical protein CI592_07210 [Fischerella thermalis CCMEE 5328]